MRLGHLASKWLKDCTIVEATDDYLQARKGIPNSPQNTFKKVTY